MEEKNVWKWPENSYNPVSMYALFSSFSPQIFDRLFDKINKYFEHVFKNYLNKIGILFIIITHSTTLDTETLKNDCSVKHTAKKTFAFRTKQIKMNKVKFSNDMKCTERSNMSKILPCCFSSLKVLPQVWEKTWYCSYTDQLKGICQHCNFYVSGGRILTEMEQNFTSKMILLKNVSAFKSINTRKKKFIYIYMYITKHDDIQRKIYNQSMEYFLRTQFVFE